MTKEEQPTREEWPVSSITMTLDLLNIVVREKSLTAIGLDKVLELVKKALEEKIPIIIEDKTTGKKYRLLEDSSLLEMNK